MATQPSSFSFYLGNYATHDLWPASGSLTFAAGDGAVKTIIVLVRADLIETDGNIESFRVLLSNPTTNISLPCTPTDHLIYDDDPEIPRIPGPGYYCPQ